MTQTWTADDDRQILAAAPLDSDDWNDATWAAWFRCAARAHGERFEGDTKPANARVLLGALLHSAQWALDLTKQGQAEEAGEHVDAIERLIASYRIAAGAIEHDAIHKHFGLSYASYMVLPRTLLQSMPQEWQSKFVALVDEMDEAFRHVPQAECYKVEAVTEHIVNEMGHELLEEAGITQDWYDQPVPEDLGPSDLNEWKAEHEKDAPTYYDRDGNQLDPEERVMLPAVDPVPHYNRGRTRVEPRLGGGE